MRGDGGVKAACKMAQLLMSLHHQVVCAMQLVHEMLTLTGMFNTAAVPMCMRPECSRINATTSVHALWPAVIDLFGRSARCWLTVL